MKCKAFCVVTEHGKWSVSGWSDAPEQQAIDMAYGDCDLPDGDEYRVIELDFDLPDDLFKRQSVTAKAMVRDGK